MKKIGWISRHLPLHAQFSELERIFGPVQVEVDPRPFDSAEKIVERIKERGYDEVVVVAPLSVIQRLVDLGVRPLWAQMHVIDPPQVPDPAREVCEKGRWYRFDRFRRIVGIKIEFEEL
jgi:hypothetical protein